MLRVWTKRLLSLGLVLASYQARADELPDPLQFYITGLSHSGSGCREGSVATNVSTDAKAFTLIFSELVVDTTMATAQPISQCRLQVGLNVPVGWSYGIAEITARGYAELPSGTSAIERSNYTFGGATSVEVGQIRLLGPYENNYTQTKKVPVQAISWSPCSDAGKKLIIDTSVRVNGSGLMTVDTLDGEVRQKYGLLWKRCQDSQNADHVAFVRSLYKNTLVRPAVPTEQNYWIRQLAQGKTREEVALSFLLSDEYRRLAIREDYQDYLGRLPEAQGETYYLNLMRQGSSRQQVRSRFLASNEYQTRAQTRYPGPAGEAFIKALYMDTLDRPAGPQELAYWVDLINRGADRPALVLGILLSDEGRTVRLAWWYHNFLHRNLEASARTYWLDKMKNAGYSEELVQAGLLGSPEYIYAH